MKPDPVLAMMTIGLVGMVYFLPTLVAWWRRHHSSGAVFTLNLLLGWTFVFWVFALLWAMIGRTKRQIVAGFAPPDVATTGHRAVSGGWVPKDDGRGPGKPPTGGSGASRPKHDPVPRFDRSDRPRPPKARRVG